MPFEQYVHKGQKRLRRGYTTGTCAALAAKAATQLLLAGTPPDTVSLVTPAGLPVQVEICDPSRTERGARCAVRKDAGDDFDVTDGMLVCAEVSPGETPGIVIDGGAGVGRVTREGLDQPVGAAAINRMPRRMIEAEVLAACAQFGYEGGLSVVISVPGGEDIAAKTFNPRLGIEGGISILGTSGIVEPQSVQALVDTIRVEMKMLAAQGRKKLIITPGNYGEAFIKASVRGGLPQVKCSNFIGDALDFAAELGFSELVLVGHIGKFVKLSAGIMNTHSRSADGRAEIFTAHAAAAGCGRDTAVRLMQSVTTDECIGILDDAGLRQPVLQSILQRVRFHASARSGLGREQVAVVLFSNVHGLLTATDNADQYLL